MREPPQLFISCADNLESLLIEEMTQCGMTGLKKGHRGINAPRTMENVFKANYLSRIATRVLWPIHSFQCLDQYMLYEEAKKIPWIKFLDEKKTFAIDANVTHQKLRNSLYASQVLKDALCDSLRELRGARPSVDVQNPDVQLNLYIHNTHAIISLDTSGAPLYKRGWKEGGVDATLPETLAAALLMRAGYTAKDTLCDPFCGSGTILLEAALIASHTPPGFYRKKWGFYQLPAFEKKAWEAFKKAYDDKRIPLAPGKIIGADQDGRAIGICTQHAEKCGFKEGIQLIKNAIGHLSLPSSPTLIVTDPPLGKRMQSSPELFSQLGKFLRHCRAAPFGYVLCSNPYFIKATGCSILSEWPLQHGGLKLSLYQIKI